MKVNELSGAALDFYVTKALTSGKNDDFSFQKEGVNVRGLMAWRVRVWQQKYEIETKADGTMLDAFETFRYSPSTNWSEGGPIIKNEKIWLSEHNGIWKASIYPFVSFDNGNPQEGHTPLIAAMRMLVCAHFGENVEYI